MSYPNNAVLLDAAFDNQVKQFTEDSKKRSAITDIDRYNQWVATLNGLGTSGRFDPPQTPAAVMDYTNTAWSARGFAGMDTLINAQETHWSIEDWPIPAYIAP